MALLSYSITSGIPVTLTCVKCWSINHQNHKHTYSHEVCDQNDRSNRCNTLYGCDDWYFSIWHMSMSQEFHWQLSNWVGPKCHIIPWPIFWDAYLSVRVTKWSSWFNSTCLMVLKIITSNPFIVIWQIVASLKFYDFHLVIDIIFIVQRFSFGFNGK